jgi:hypothetical protein
MNIPDMDWAAGWSDQVKKDKGLDWETEWERGYIDGMYKILALFEKELYTATKEDPQYAMYVQDAVDLIKQKINSNPTPLTKE